VHAVVSNLPWDRQVEVDASLRALYADAYTEMRRVLSPGGALVLLTPYADLIPDPATDSFEISVYGQNPRVLVFR
jgi:23S rRNA G2445 N2-methylase RlmL